MNKNVHPIIILLMCLCFSTNVLAGSSVQTVAPEKVGLSSKRLELIDQLMLDHINDKKIAGSVVMIARHGQIAYFKAFGMADADTPMQADTIFRLASMSKPLTSLAAMMLYEEGKFLLSDPVSNYIPGFKEPKILSIADQENPQGEQQTYQYRLIPATREVTIRDLLAHTAGITYGFFADWYPDPKHITLTQLYHEASISDGLCQPAETIGEMVKRLVRLPLYDQPGEMWEYGLGIDVLGYLIEVVSGQPLDVFMQERVFQPLQMHDTYFFVPQEEQHRISALWDSDWNGTLQKLTQWPIKEGNFIFCPQDAYKTSGTYLSGGAGIHATAYDYYRFCQMLLNKGELDGTRFLSRKTVELMTATNHIGDFEATMLHGNGWKFGLGFAIQHDRAHDVDSGAKGTYEWAGIYSTRFSVDPVDDKITIMMTQTHPFSNTVHLWETLVTLSNAALMD